MDARVYSLAEYTRGILRLQENPHVLSWLTDMRFLWKCRIDGRFLIETDSEDSVANVFFI